MPTINKPKKKKVSNSQKVKDIYDNVYNTSRWRRLREGLLIMNPLCQVCMKNLATEVHHIKEISSGNSIEEYITLGFDSNNLLSICSECHKIIHGKKKNKLDIE